MNELAIKPTHDLLGFIERASKDVTFDVGKFGALLDRQQELLRQYQLGLFNQAYAALQAEIGTIVKTKRNPIFKNPYASLEDLDREARPICGRHGFSVRYSTDENWREGWLLMKLTLAHEGGHSEVTSLPGPFDLQQPSQRSQERGTNQPARSPLQAIGSTVSYLRRYCLQMALNLVPANDPADDDGAATRRGRYGPPREEENYHKDEIRSDGNADEIIAAMAACKDHTELHVYRQTVLPGYWKNLLQPDRDRVEEAYRELAKTFAAQGPGKLVPTSDGNQ